MPWPCSPWPSRPARRDDLVGIESRFLLSEFVFSGCATAQGRRSSGWLKGRFSSSTTPRLTVSSTNSKQVTVVCQASPRTCFPQSMPRAVWARHAGYTRRWAVQYPTNPWANQSRHRRHRRSLQAATTSSLPTKTCCTIDSLPVTAAQPPSAFVPCCCSTQEQSAGQTELLPSRSGVMLFPSPGPMLNRRRAEFQSTEGRSPAWCRAPSPAAGGLPVTPGKRVPRGRESSPEGLLGLLGARCGKPGEGGRRSASPAFCSSVRRLPL